MWWFLCDETPQMKRLCGLNYKATYVHGFCIFKNHPTRTARAYFTHCTNWLNTCTALLLHFIICTCYLVNLSRWSDTDVGGCCWPTYRPNSGIKSLTAQSPKWTKQVSVKRMHSSSSLKLGKVIEMSHLFQSQTGKKVLERASKVHELFRLCPLVTEQSHLWSRVVTDKVSSNFSAVSLGAMAVHFHTLICLDFFQVWP